MTYAIAKAAQKNLEEVCNVLSAKLNTYPKGKMGLTPDAVKCTPEWKSDKAAFQKAFAAFRNFNQSFVKTYKKEMREERRERYAS